MDGDGRRGPPGSAASFDRLYDAERVALHAYFLGRTSDPEVAQDLLQEAFLRAWRNISKLRDLPEDRQRYWLYAVARNLVTDHHRADASRTRSRQAAAVDPRWQRGGVEDPQAVAAHREKMEDLDRAMEELPEELRTVLSMQVVGGLSSGRIGEALEKPAGTIRYQLSVARKRLAESLKSIDGGGSGTPEQKKGKIGG